ncbi:MAG: tetratricopeptide repeat protein [Archangium sp.]|nr:tetratricopeptide repeat protein [Archangium sp.]
MLSLLVVVMVAAAPEENPFRARVEALRALKNTGQAAEVKASGEKLLQDLTTAARAKNHTGETLLLLGRTQLYLEDDAAAALSLDEAITLSPLDADAHFYRGVAAQHLDALEAAVRHFRKATELAPKQVRGWAELGGSLADLGQKDRALDALKKAIALDPKDAYSKSIAGRLLIDTGKGAEGIALLEESLKLEPRDMLAAYNAGLYYQLAGQPKRALGHFEAVALADADDWHARAKLVQLHQALGELPARDRRRAEVLALFKAKKVEAEHRDFCREQFALGGKNVLVFESFELTGERAVRYSFRVAAPPGNKLQRVISLGSYEFTTDYMRGSGELKADERAWHLDGYFPDNSHQTYGIFTAEPTYEQTRAMVVDVLEGRLKASSSMTPRKK